MNKELHEQYIEDFYNVLYKATAEFIRKECLAGKYKDMPGIAVLNIEPISHFILNSIYGSIQSLEKEHRQEFIEMFKKNFLMALDQMCQEVFDEEN